MDRSRKRIDFSFSKFSNLNYDSQNWKPYEVKPDPEIKEKPIQENVVSKPRPAEPTYQERKVEEEEEEEEEEIDEAEFEQSPFIHPVTPIPVNPSIVETEQEYGVMNNFRRKLITYKRNLPDSSSTGGFPSLNSRERMEERFNMSRSHEKLTYLTRRKRERLIRRTKKGMMKYRLICHVEGEKNLKKTLLERVMPSLDYFNKVKEVSDKLINMMGSHKSMFDALQKCINERHIEFDKELDRLEAEERRKAKEEEEAERKRKEEEEEKKKKGGKGTKKKEGEAEADGDSSWSEQTRPSDPFEGLRKEFLKNRNKKQTPPKNCEPGAFGYLMDVSKSLVCAISAFSQIDTRGDEEFKELRRIMKTAVNQISTNLKQVGEKFKKVAQELNKAKKKHISLYYWGLFTLVEALVVKSIREISKAKDRDITWSFAHMAMRLSFKFRHFRNIFIGYILNRFVCAIPWNPMRRTGMSDEDYKVERLKYKKSRSGVVEEDSTYLSRVEAIMCLYMAYICLPVRPHPHPVSFAWAWFSRILNLSPSISHASAIIGFLDIASATLYAKYKGQFVKQLKLLEKDVLPKIQDLGGSESALGRIQLYLNAFKEKKKPPDNKFATLEFWKEV